MLDWLLRLWHRIEKLFHPSTRTERTSFYRPSNMHGRSRR